MHEDLLNSFFLFLELDFSFLSRFRIDSEALIHLEGLLWTWHMPFTGPITTLPGAGFELEIPLFECPRAGHALDDTATVIRCVIAMVIK
jgi:hypothetical protein